MKKTSKLLLIGLIALLLGTSASCGGRAHKAPMKGIGGSATVGGTGDSPVLASTPTNLQDALAELDALEKPEGVDAKVWEELKGALREALACRAGTCAPPSGDSGKTSHGGLQVAALQQNPEWGKNAPPPGEDPEPGWSARRTHKLISTPPTGAANKVNDLTATRETNGDFTLSWHYRNLGDYDQNGVVGVSDITPLAMHFNETYDADAEPDCIQAVVDGSGNGKVGVEDVTQLAQYFGNEFAQYAMQGGDQQQGPFTQAFTTELPAGGRSDARLAFTFNLFDLPDYTYWRVVPLDGNNNPGEASNVATLNVEARVRVLGVTPLSGLAGADVTFTAFVAGTGPFTYEWDFDGGATPNTSTAAQPTVTLGVNGEYPAQVKVTGANGSATRHFTLTVTTMPGEPPVINSVGPFAGLSGEQLNFSADVTGDEPLTYSWEFDGGASPPVSAEANPTAILSRGGTLPAPAKDYPCRLTVSNPSGSASSDFTLTVSAQWHLIDIPSNMTGSMPASYRSDGLLAVVAMVGDEWQYLVLQQENWVGEAAPPWGFMTLDFHPMTGEPVAVCDTGPFGNRLVNYAWRSGGIWNKEEVGGGGMISNTALLAFHHDGSPVIAWTEIGDKSKVAVAEKNYGNWQVEYLPAGDLSIWLFSLAVDGQDRIVASYSAEVGANWEAWIAIKQGDGWVQQQLPDYSECAELGLLPDGSLQANIVRRPPYPANAVLSYGVLEGNTWMIEDADTGAAPYEMGEPLVLADGIPLLLCSSYDYETNATEFRASWETLTGWVSERQFPQTGNPNAWEGTFIGIDSSGTLAVRLTETADTTPVSWWNHYGLFW